LDFFNRPVPVGGVGAGSILPLTLIKPLINELVTTGRIRRINRGYPGISGVSITQALAINYQLPVNAGVGVISVASGAPADQAGLPGRAESGGYYRRTGKQRGDQSFGLE